MILAKLQADDAHYDSRLRSALAWLRRQDWVQLEDGRHELEQGMFAQLFHIHEMKGEADFEVHQAYHDVQMVLSGREAVRWRATAADCRLLSAEPEQDIAFYGGAAQLSFILEPGQFAFYPAGELHAVGVAADGAALRKVVIKMPVTPEALP